MYQQNEQTISKESLNNDGQQFYQYQQNEQTISKESLNNDGQ